MQQLFKGSAEQIPFKRQSLHCHLLQCLIAKPLFHKKTYNEIDYQNFVICTIYKFWFCLEEMP